MRRLTPWMIRQAINMTSGTATAKVAFFPHGQPAHVIGIAEVRDEHLEGGLGVVGRPGDLLNNGVQEKMEVLGAVVGRRHGEEQRDSIILPGIAVDDDRARGHGFRTSAATRRAQR